jgi:hypothetical protein
MYHSWDDCREMVVEHLKRSLPAGEAFIFIDDEQLGLGEHLAGRRVIPFLERNGKYWGAPDGDTQAIEDLQRLRGKGTRWLAIGWPSFWWLDQYGRFRLHLAQHSTCRLSTPHLQIYELNQ